MTLKRLTREQYQTAISEFDSLSFTQSVAMAELLTKRGFTVDFVGYEAEDAIQVAGLLYSMPMTGGLHMEMNSGPASKNTDYLQPFYSELQTYAAAKGAIELIIKPYDTYQTFDTNGEPSSDEKPELITTLTDLGFVFDGLQTGYPGGEPDWHYVKELSGLTAENLRQSYSKKGRALAKKTASFGIKVRKLERSELHIFKEITSSTSERRDYDDKPLDYYEAFYDSFAESCEFMVATINFQDYLTNLETGRAKLLAQIDELETKLTKGFNPTKINRQKGELTSQLETFDVRIKEAEELIASYGTEEVVLAGSLFIYTPQEAVYLFSGSYTEFNKFYAPVALQEYVMAEAIRRDIHFYTFLGIQGIFDGTDGVLRFKQNFNGYIVRKMGTFRYYPKPLKYKFIQFLKRIIGR